MAHNQLLRALRHPADTANKEIEQSKGWFHYYPAIHLYSAETLLLYYSKHDFVFKKSAFHINSHCRSICDVQLHNIIDVHQREHSAPAQPTLTLTIVHTFYHLAFLISAFHDCNSARPQAVRVGCV